MCDEMGLGKTIECLGLIKNQPLSRTLIFAPLAVLEQWAATAEKASIQVWRPHKTEAVWIPNGSVARRRILALLGAPNIYLVSYELARSRDDLIFGQIEAWDRLVCDEAHRIAGKNLNSALVGLIKCSARWFLTATPIVNGMHNLHTLLGLLGYEGSQYMSKGERDALIRQCVIARTMDQLRAIMPDAPPRPVFVKHSLPFLTDDEREFYTGIQGLLTKRFRVLEDERKNGFERFRLLMRLRQLSLHPQIYIEARKKILGRAYNRPDWTGTSTKFEKIQELFSASAGEPHKWIIFCHFHSEMEMLQTSLRALPFVRHVGIYSGAENAGQREKVLAESREPLLTGADVHVSDPIHAIAPDFVGLDHLRGPSPKSADVLLVQLQAGGVGLNLQHCDRIIFTGPWWTSALMEQAVGRAVRIGQKAVVEVHHLILKEEEGMNIDRVIMEKAVTKGEMCRDVLKVAFTDMV